MTTKVSNNMADMASIAADSTMTTMVDGRIRSNSIVQGTPTSGLSGPGAYYYTIPSTAKRIVISYIGVSCTAAQQIRVCLSTGGTLDQAGYACTSTTITSGASPTSAASTVSFLQGSTSNAAGTLSGVATLTLIDASTNTWACTSSAAQTDTTVQYLGTGTKSLAGTIDRVALLCDGTFDAGKLNVQYE